MLGTSLEGGVDSARTRKVRTLATRNPEEGLRAGQVDHWKPLAGKLRIHTPRDQAIDCYSRKYRPCFFKRATPSLDFASVHAFESLLPEFQRAHLLRRHFVAVGEVPDEC